MTLNHINLSVSDVAGATAMFRDYFGLSLREEKGNGVLNVLEDDAGFILILSNLEKDVQYAYPRDFHIGFYLDTKEAVNALFEKITDAGFPATNCPKLLRDAWTFYFVAFDTLTIEVTCRNP
jgi:catechol 2,3-dioxygenase-like lactoylglutathione lyase family enzyme